MGAVSFIGNSASAHGGAIALTRPDAFNASGGNFFWNSAAFGGAISLVFTDVTEDEGFADDRRAEFDDCQFHGNNASFGGASYMDTRSQQVSIRNSSFRENMAGERDVTCGSGGTKYQHRLGSIESLTRTRNPETYAGIDRWNGHDFCIAQTGIERYSLL